MTEEQIKARVESVFQDILDRPGLSLSRGTTADQVDGWDSLSHVSLIEGVEKEFKLNFTLREIKSFKNVGDMFDVIRSKAA